MKRSPEDPALHALYFQYGRYLLIASSRPGTQAANLQGYLERIDSSAVEFELYGEYQCADELLAGRDVQPSECHQPLFDLIEQVSTNGHKTAEVNYGAKGWVSHHNIDLWRQSAPVGNYGGGAPTWANWQMSAPWLCAHFWEHFLFSQDKAFLRASAFPR